MAATVESSNDTKAITEIVKDLQGFADDLKETAAQLSKSADAMKKKPDECKDAAQKAAGILLGVSKAAKDYDATIKKIQKAVVK